MRFGPRFPVLLLFLGACGAPRDTNDAAGTAARIPGAVSGEAPLPPGTQALRDSIRNRSAERFRERPDSNLARADTARSLGDAGAKVWVVFVGHLQDERSAAVVRDLLPELKRLYVAPGKIRFAFVNAPEDATQYNARFAAHAAYCAALGGKFWPVFEQIAATRDDWDRLPDPQPRFDSLAVKVGADAAVQAACTYRKLMMPLIMWDRERAQKAGVKNIPALLIGDQQVTGDLSLARVSKVIDAALGGK